MGVGELGGDGRLLREGGDDVLRLAEEAHVGDDGDEAVEEDGVDVQDGVAEGVAGEVVVPGRRGLLGDEAELAGDAVEERVDLGRRVRRNLLVWLD